MLRKISKHIKHSKKIYCCSDPFSESECPPIEIDEKDWLSNPTQYSHCFENQEQCLNTCNNRNVPQMTQLVLDYMNEPEEFLDYISDSEIRHHNLLLIIIRDDDVHNAFYHEYEDRDTNKMEYIYDILNDILQDDVVVFNKAPRYFHELLFVVQLIVFTFEFDLKRDNDRKMTEFTQNFVTIFIPKFLDILKNKQWINPDLFDYLVLFYRFQAIFTLYKIESDSTVVHEEEDNFLYIFKKWNENKYQWKNGEYYQLLKNHWHFPGSTTLFDYLMDSWVSYRKYKNIDYDFLRLFIESLSLNQIEDLYQILLEPVEMFDDDREEKTFLPEVIEIMQHIFSKNAKVFEWKELLEDYIRLMKILVLDNLHNRYLNDKGKSLIQKWEDIGPLVKELKKGFKIDPTQFDVISDEIRSIWNKDYLSTRAILTDTYEYILYLEDYLQTKIKNEEKEKMQRDVNLNQNIQINPSTFVATTSAIDYNRLLQQENRIGGYKNYKLRKLQIRF